uniref:RING-type domain-containing protein n=1 Tax=Arcella intermedia TaxID=1963864 RepID=A0A6B2L1G2_9EUKA
MQVVQGKGSETGGEGVSLFDVPLKKIVEAITLLEKKNNQEITSFGIDCASEKLDSKILEMITSLCLKQKNLKKLFLRGNRIDAVGASIISEYLRNEKCVVEELDLRCNELGENGAVALFTAMHVNRSLEKLLLCKNEVNNIAAHFFASSLKNLKCPLQMCDLSENCIGPEGLLSIVGTFKDNFSLKTLLLDGNVDESTNDTSLSLVYATAAEGLTTNLSLRKLSLPKPHIFLQNNFKYWEKAIEQYLSRNSLLQLRYHIAQNTPPPIPHLYDERSNLKTNKAIKTLQKLKDTIEKSESIFLAELIQLQNFIRTIDIAQLHERYEHDAEALLKRERALLGQEITKIHMTLEWKEKKIEKLEKDIGATRIETIGLYGVIREVEKQNAQLKERVKKLEKSLKKMLKENHNPSDADQNVSDLLNYIESQREVVENLMEEKEKIVSQAEMQFIEIQKKNNQLEQLMTTPTPNKAQSEKHVPPATHPKATPHKDTQDHHLCVVCQDAVKVVAFIPCGHRCACEKCAGPLIFCPICRIPSHSKARIWD